MTSLGPRADFRENNCLRSVECTEVGSVGEASGSGKFASGKSVAWASTYGPAAPRFARHEFHDRGCLEVELTLLGETSSCRERLEKEGRMFLQKTLEQTLQLVDFPRTLILLKVCIIRNDGCSLAVALNACVLSLLDAALPMYFCPVAVSCCRTTSGDLLLDPTVGEENNAAASFLAVFSDSRLISSECTGEYSQDDFMKAYTILKASAPLVELAFKDAISNKMSPAEKNSS